jgi:hypothetical protein
MPEAGDTSRRNGRPVTVLLVTLLLAACAFAYAIGVAWADDGGSNAASSGGTPATQPVQQSQDDNNQQRPRDDCPEHDGDGGEGGSGSSGSSGSSDSSVRF